MIQNAVDYVRGLTGKPWLVLGKGPTSDLIETVDLTRYRILSLNHACRLVVPDLAHFVDLEAFDECGERLAKKEIVACLPWYPHVSSGAGRHPLSHYCGLLPDPPHKRQALGWLLAKDKLCSYNASTASAKCHVPNPKLSHVRLRFFSAVGAFNLLGLAGIRCLTTLGVDGGTGYGKAFDAKDKLANGRMTFDDQTKSLFEACGKHKMRWLKLGEEGACQLN